MKKEKSFYKKTLGFFKPFWVPITIMLLIMVFIQLLGTLSPYLFGKSVDAVIHHNIRLTFIFVGIAAGFALINNVLMGWIREHVEIKFLDSHIEQSFSVNSLKTMFSFSIGQHINEHSGVKLGIVNKGQGSLNNFMYAFLYNVLPSVLQIVVTTVVLAFFDWRVALTAVIFIAIYINFALRKNQDFFPSLQEITKKNRLQGKLQSELFRNSTLVISEAQEKNTEADFKKSSDATVDFETSIWLKYLESFYGYRIFIVLGQYVTLALGVYFILIGDHSTGMFVTLFAWTGSIFSNLISIVAFQREALSQIVEIKKFFDLLDIQPDIDINEKGIVIEDLKGKIEFKNVSFAYPYRQSTQEMEDEEESEEDKKEDHTISDVSFTVPAGAKVGFVGVSGSGKSTIVNLMRRFYDPTSGDVFIDDVNLKDMNLRWLRLHIGNVEQKIDLFDRSIKDNILFGLPSDVAVSEEKLQKAVEEASLTDFVAKLKENGLDTVIGEGGIKVSGGERQRIGIARALIKDPKILIFDEATSALDSINEKLIHDAINRSAEGRTTIIIAHRLSTVMDADIIFVVSEGKIVASGTHKELEQKSEQYKELIKNQILMS